MTLPAMVLLCTLHARAHTFAREEIRATAWAALAAIIALHWGRA